MVESLKHRFCLGDPMPLLVIGCGEYVTGVPCLGDPMSLLVIGCGENVTGVPCLGVGCPGFNAGAVDHIRGLVKSVEYLLLSVGKHGK